MFLCSRLNLPGGIERAIANTAALLQSKGYKISLFILDNTAESFYPVKEGIKIIQQPLSFGITKEGNIISRKITLLTDVLKLRKQLKQLNADIVIATEYPFAVAAMLSGVRKRAKLLSWEHHHFYELKRSAFWNRLFNYTYPKLDGIICLNTDEQKIYTAINPAVFVIPNSITSTGRQSLLTNKNILTVARLNYVKGMDRLTAVARTVLLSNPGWTWKVIGAGELGKKIDESIRAENLSAQLEIYTPHTHDIIDEYATASIYVMLSRNECLPMTLIEAQSCGLPCIAFDCETGPRHIIADDENGFLIKEDDLNAMSEAINRLITDDHKRTEFGKLAVENSKLFAPSLIAQKWETLIKQLT